MKKRVILQISLLLMFSYVFLTMGQIFAKLASRDLMGLGTKTLLFIAGTYFFFFLRGVLWVFLLRKVKLVLAYPLMSVGYVLVLIVSFHLFDETLTIGKLAGALLIIAGVTAVSIGEMRIHREDKS